MDCRHRDRGKSAHRPVARTQPQRAFGAVDRLLVRPLMDKWLAEKGMSYREVRVQLQRPTQCAHGLTEATQAIEQIAPCQVCPGVTIVEGERGLRLRANLARN